jgi:hypothetical protein
MDDHQFVSSKMLVESFGNPGFDQESEKWRKEGIGEEEEL